MMPVPSNSLPVRAQETEEGRAPSLHVIEGTDPQIRKGSLGLLVLVAAVFMLAIIVPLVANTNMAQLSYDVRDLRVSLNEENAAIDSLEKQLTKVSSAEGIAEKATEIGMVPAGLIGVISLKDGTVEGGYAAQ